MSKPEVRDGAINVITAIGNPELEALISRTLFNSGNDIRLRAISFDEVITFCEVDVSENERWVIVASSDLLGFSHREFIALQQESLTCVLLDSTNVPTTSDAINALIATQIRAPMVHRASPPRRLVSAIGITGTMGSPGRSTLALNLASELSEFQTVTLVDSDINNATLAYLLGLNDFKWSDEKRYTLSPNFHLVTEREFSRDSLERDRRYIVDIGPIKNVNEILTDRRSSGRHQAQWLESCSTLIYVVKADDRSLAHLEQFLLERRNLPARQEIIFVLNQLGNSRWFRSHEKAFKDSAPGAKFLLPLDHSVTERTRTQHTTLKEIAPRSALRRSIGEIARHIES